VTGVQTCALPISGTIGMLGQGHATGTAWWKSGTAGGWTDLGPTFGAYPVEVEGLGRGWIVYIMRASDRYARLTIDGAPGRVVSETDVGVSPTSQGFLDVTEPRLAFTDAAFRIGDVCRPNRCGPDYLVGQYYADPPRMVLADRYGTVLRVLAEGLCHEPHAAWLDGRLVACSRSTAQAAMVVAGAVEDFPLFVPAPEPPQPEPEPEPTMGMLETLQGLRGLYGPTMTDDECVELLNEAAFIHAAEGYGLSRKETGTRGRRYDGQECCHDVLMWRDGTYWDVLMAAGGASVPTWGPPSGTITDPRRGWVAPIVPQGGVVVPPEPPDPPPSGNVCWEVEARVAALETWARAFRG